jgi:hypothetical protein
MAVEGKGISAMEALKERLRQAWDRYKIYAEASMDQGVFPAPFGATTEEKQLREAVAEYHVRPW